MEYPIIDALTEAYLNNGWTGLEITYGKNLFDKNAILDEEWIDVNSTNTSPADGFCVTDYIPIKQGDILFMPYKGTSRNAYYDTSKNGIAYFSYSGNVALTVPYNGFARFALYKGSINMDTFQIEHGNQATAYAPYVHHPVI